MTYRYKGFLHTAILNRKKVLGGQEVVLGVKGFTSGAPLEELYCTYLEKCFIETVLTKFGRKNKQHTTLFY